MNGITIETDGVGFMIIHMDGYNLILYVDSEYQGLLEFDTLKDAEYGLRCWKRLADHKY